MCRKLNLPILRSEKLILNAFESDSEEVRNIKVVKAEIRDIWKYTNKCRGACCSKNLLTHFSTNHRDGPIHSRSDSTDGNSNLEIQVLIGGDQYWNFVSGKIIRNFGGPVAMETSLGWVLSGLLNIPTETSSCVMKLGCRVDESVNTEKTIMNKINEFWETENLGLFEIEESITFGEKNITMYGYHGNATLSILSDNFTMCKSRLKSLLMRLKTDPIRLK